MHAFTHLKVDVEGELGRLILSRKAQRNALNSTLLQELTRAAHWFDQQPNVRVVIVRAEGDYFCVGADIKDLPIKEALPESGLSWQQRREIGQQGKRMVDALASMRALTIAEVQGAAIGGGLLIMLACDFRLVAEDTKLAIPEVALGIPLAWGGIPRLVREIGPLRTKELVMTGRIFTPQEAREMGLINRVFSAAVLSEHTTEMARTLLARPAVPLAISKEHINAVAEQMGPVADSFADGDLLLGLIQDPEARKAVTAYIDSLSRQSL